MNLRSLVKSNCNICKVFSTKPYRANLTAKMPKFRTEQRRPFEFTKVDFAWPIIYKVGKMEEAKAFIVIFTCAVMRAIHLEVTKSRTAEEIIGKLNAFIAGKTRPEVIISDNGGDFKATAEWIKNCERVNLYLTFLRDKRLNGTSI